MKHIILTSIGAVGSIVAGLLGGWDSSLITLLIFMAIDYTTGLIVAGVFHKSKKTESGALESRAGFKGLIKKCMVLLYVIVGNRLDIEFGIDYCRTGVCIAFMTNELISIVENGRLMGLPIPETITNAIDLLNKKGVKQNG